MGPKTREMVRLQQMQNGGAKDQAEREKRKPKDRISLSIMENQEQGRRPRQWRRKANP